MREARIAGCRPALKLATALSAGLSRRFTGRALSCHNAGLQPALLLRDATQGFALGYYNAGLQPALLTGR